jgi:hypothetical protein
VGFSSFNLPAFAHRALTAFLATSLLSSGVIVLARALPPFDAPSADMAFAASLANAGNNSFSLMPQTLHTPASIVKYKVEQVLCLTHARARIEYLYE